MNKSVRRCLAALLICALFSTTSSPARADELKNDAIWAVVGIVLVTAAITVAVVLGVKHKPSVTGCAVDTPAGLELTTEGDEHQMFVLAGDTSGIKPGERVKLQGRKKAADASGLRHFVVEKFRKDYGVCKVAAAP